MATLPPVQRPRKKFAMVCHHGGLGRIRGVEWAVSHETGWREVQCVLRQDSQKSVGWRVRIQHAGSARLKGMGDPKQNGPRGLAGFLRGRGWRSEVGWTGVLHVQGQEGTLNGLAGEVEQAYHHRHNILPGCIPS